MTKRMKAPSGGPDERGSPGRTREGVSFPAAPSTGKLPDSYIAAFAEIKERIREERLRVVLAGMPRSCCCIGTSDWDDLLRHPDDRPTIGLLLCKSKDRLVVEYALRGFDKPMGVAEWETRLVESLPDELKGSLPSVEEIEEELNGSRSAQA